MKKKIKILLVSSSTGGHAIPVDMLRKTFLEDGNFAVSVVHSGSEIEKQLFWGKNCYLLSSGKIHRYQLWKNLWQAIKIFAALIKSIYILCLVRPKVIISKGGFNAYPILFWARFCRIAYFIHETDSVMGLSNKTFYQGAIKAFVSFPVSEYNLPGDNLLYSGMIVRKIAGKNHIFLNRPKILIAGGSQGAATINECIEKSLPRLLPNYEIYLSLGTNGKIDLKNLGEDQQTAQHFHPFEFSIDKFAEYLSECDLVISRAGGTIGEVARLKKPSILIPYPYAASDHQMRNAHYLEKKGGAIVIKEKHLSPETLIDRINFILKNPDNAKIIGENAYAAIKTDGGTVICNEVKKYLGVK